MQSGRSCRRTLFHRLMPGSVGLNLAICVQDLGQVEYVLSDKTGALSLIVHARLRMCVSSNVVRAPVCPNRSFSIGPEVRSNTQAR